MPKMSGLMEEQVESMIRLANLPAFRDVISKVEADEVSVHSVAVVARWTWTLFSMNILSLCSNFAFGWRAVLLNRPSRTYGTKRSLQVRSAGGEVTTRVGKDLKNHS